MVARRSMQDAASMVFGDGLASLIMRSLFVGCATADSVPMKGPAAAIRLGVSSILYQISLRSDVRAP